MNNTNLPKSLGLSNKYGTLALVAGASEGLGAAFAERLAAEGFDIILIARRMEPLTKLANILTEKYGVSVDSYSCDLATADAAPKIYQYINGREVGLIVYNAAISYIGHFEQNSPHQLQQMAQANVVTPLLLTQLLGKKMLQNQKGAIVLMSSIAGFQGSGFLSSYAATKAFSRVLAEGLWYEWKDRNVAVIGCCAGATATPNFINTKPEKASLFAPKVQTPSEVVNECFEKLGKTPSFVTGTGNKIATFVMEKLLSRKMAITIMGDTARKMYRF